MWSVAAQCPIGEALNPRLHPLCLPYCQRPRKGSGLCWHIVQQFLEALTVVRTSGLCHAGGHWDSL